MSDLRLTEQQQLKISEFRQTAKDAKVLNDSAIISILKAEGKWEAQQSDTNSLWGNVGFSKTPDMKGLFVEKSTSPYSMIVNVPVDTKELASFMKELGTATAWADDFSKQIKTKNDLAVMKELSALKNKDGNRLYDNFQLFQFVGGEGAKKIELAKRFLNENPEFTNSKFNGYLINYMTENKVSNEDASEIIQNPNLAQRTLSVAGIVTKPERINAIIALDNEMNGKLKSIGAKPLININYLDDAQFKKYLDTIKTNENANVQGFIAEEKFNDNLPLIGLIKDKELQNSLYKLNSDQREDKQNLAMIKRISMGLTQFKGDRKILDEIKKELNELSNSKENFEEKTKKIELLEKIVNFNNYVNDGSEVFRDIHLKSSFSLMKSHLGYKSITKEIETFDPAPPNGLNEILEKLGLIKDPKVKLADETSDFLEQNKLSPLKKFLAENPDNELSSYLYENYYVKTQPATDQKHLTEINSKYNVKVFLSNRDKGIGTSEIFNDIDKELNNWKTASNGKAKMPPILDLNTIQYSFLNDEATGLTNIYTKQISIDTHWNLENALRHELMHINDEKLTQEDSEIKYNEKVLTDQTLYRKQFEKAGLEEELIDYAYTNRDEFVAVAAEGDLSKYSDDFKKVLKDLGMPEWVFKLSHGINDKGPLFSN